MSTGERTLDSLRVRYNVSRCTIEQSYVVPEPRYTTMSSDKATVQQTGLNSGEYQRTISVSYHRASQAVFQNVLEMTMCRAFESLPGNILEAYFGPKEDGRPYSNLGLNILPPLLQGLSLSPSIRKSFSFNLETSTDPDINSWPNFRLEYERTAKKSPINFQCPLMKPQELRSCFLKALHQIKLTQPVWEANKSPPHMTEHYLDPVFLSQMVPEPIDTDWANLRQQSLLSWRILSTHIQNIQATRIPSLSNFNIVAGTWPIPLHGLQTL